MLSEWLCTFSLGSPSPQNPKSKTIHLPMNILSALTWQSRCWQYWLYFTSLSSCGQKPDPAPWALPGAVQQLKGQLPMGLEQAFQPRHLTSWLPPFQVSLVDAAAVILTMSLVLGQVFVWLTYSHRCHFPWLTLDYWECSLLPFKIMWYP